MPTSTAGNKETIENKELQLWYIKTLSRNLNPKIHHRKSLSKGVLPIMLDYGITQGFHGHGSASWVPMGGIQDYKRPMDNALMKKKA